MDATGKNFLNHVTINDTKVLVDQEMLVSTLTNNVSNISNISIDIEDESLLSLKMQTGL